MLLIAEINILPRFLTQKNLTLRAFCNIMYLLNGDPAQMTRFYFGKIFTIIFSISFLINFAQAQTPRRSDNRVRTVTIPISILSKAEVRERQLQEFLEAGDLVVKEDGDEQTILSIRDVSAAPLALAILIQDDLSSNFNLELRRLSEFIRHLPRGSRVMVAYLRGGTVQIRQRFTEDLEKASQALRIVSSSSSGAGGSPYAGVIDTLKRFEALPQGRRAMLLISDGLDISQGIQGSSPTQSIDLEQAILRAQRNSVAVYSFYSSATLTENGSSNLILNAQGALSRLSDETGGRAFFQGTYSPVSLDPFFRDLTMTLNRQFALTYLSTHMKKGYHRIQVTSTNPQVRIEHPSGYYYR
jgi:VWFA-related protein